MLELAWRVRRRAVREDWRAAHWLPVCEMDVDVDVDRDAKVGELVGERRRLLVFERDAEACQESRDVCPLEAKRAV